MTDPFATTISFVALAISAGTAWFTFFRKGTVRMTRPTVIFFGPDGGRDRDNSRLPKVFLRTLLFSTSKRGRIVESMHITLIRNETRQNFNIWVYGNEKLVRGSGLFVSETGFAANHHFLAPPDGTSFEFKEGLYTLNVYAKVLGDAATTLLASERLEVSREDAIVLKEPEAGLYFDWGPDSSRYFPHIDKYVPAAPLADLTKFEMPERRKPGNIHDGQMQRREANQVSE